ncbi:Transcription initiation factor TFIID subunit 7 [Zancudomyces culisetae]|uniref:Transcription initiation factor TFIID subunit 7 n=1 Tax=Zancudomyces culisetae TaxID=1213189 RepID=A0A1R1PW74_ZANCU|nr:Transcription initiation factor TFIID subunit 7 [Zancudomyces culisetae]|eukprot:OMH85220.1 Transcription initiation factor TFIID subunit 7 [Zancudomyces culisetae]
MEPENKIESITEPKVIKAPKIKLKFKVPEPKNYNEVHVVIGNKSETFRRPKPPALSTAQPETPKTRKKRGKRKGYKHNLPITSFKPRNLKLKLGDNGNLTGTKTSGWYDELSDSDSPDYYFEDQFIVRVPEEISEEVKKIVDAREVNERIDITFKSNRRAIFRFDDKCYKARLVDLPTITESYRTVDKRQILKVADISQVSNTNSPEFGGFLNIVWVQTTLFILQECVENERENTAFNRSINVCILDAISRGLDFRSNSGSIQK